MLTKGNQTLMHNIVKPPVEIERKYIVFSLPNNLDLSNYPVALIKQGYLVSCSQGAVRVRQNNKKYFLTSKRALANHLIKREEYEVELSKQQFDKLWPGTLGRRLQKNRYLIPFDEYMIELDVFSGDSSGRMLAEVEFSTVAEADKFRPPSWFGRDVTDDARYSNAYIAEFGYPETR